MRVNSNMSNNEIDKKKMVLDTINFLTKERNKYLFQISSARINKKRAIKDEQAALKKSRLLKKRIVNEVFKNVDILNGDKEETKE